MFVCEFLYLRYDMRIYKDHVSTPPPIVARYIGYYEYSVFSDIGTLTNVPTIQVLCRAKNGLYIPIQGRLC